MLSFTEEAQNTKPILHLTLWNIQKPKCLENKKSEKNLQPEHHTDKSHTVAKSSLKISALLSQAMSGTILYRILKYKYSAM
jgi:hypothetical protein